MAKKATILIIDKEKMIVDLLVRSVSSADTTVLGATSAEEAARLIDLYGPELVVIGISETAVVEAPHAGLTVAAVYDRRQCRISE